MQHLHKFSISDIPSNIFLMNLSRQLEDYHIFLVSYMGYTMEEVETSMHLNQDHKTCVLKMLSLWRCKDEQDEVKTVGHLLSALKDILFSGPYRTLEKVIDGKCSIESLIMLKNPSLNVLICYFFTIVILYETNLSLMICCCANFFICNMNV